MEQVRYMISDAASIVAVESHVLRYWEDELELTVPRNEMGHRYYTQENVDQFLRIKELKEEGYQLKAIKILLQQEKQDRLHNESSAAADHIAQPLPVGKQEQPLKQPAPIKQVPENWDPDRISDDNVKRMLKEYEKKSANLNLIKVEGKNV